LKGDDPMRSMTHSSLGPVVGLLFFLIVLGVPAWGITAALICIDAGFVAYIAVRIRQSRQWSAVTR